LEEVICLTHCKKKKKKKKKKHQEGLTCPGTARSKVYNNIRHHDTLADCACHATGDLSATHLVPASTHLITVCCSRPAGATI
jgi:hypothetical protein